MSTHEGETSPSTAAATTVAATASTPSPSSATISHARTGSEIKSSLSASELEETGFLHLVDDIGNFGCSERGLVNLTKRAKRSASSAGN